MFIPSKQARDYEFSDFRLSKRFLKIQRALSKDLSLSIPQSMKNKAQTKAVYNFFHNKKVTPEKIYAQHMEKLCPRIETYFNGFQNNRFGSEILSSKNTRRILALSDTVEFDYTNKENSTQLGPLNDRKRRGLQIHNTLLTNNLGTPIDLLNQKMIIRTDEDFGKSVERKNHPIETKESYKWYQHFLDAQSLLENLSKQTYSSENPYEMVYIADREGDFNELLQAKQHENMHYIIRSQHNRNLTILSDNEIMSKENSIKISNGTSKNIPKQIKLKAFLDTQDVDLEYDILVSNPVTKKKRIAKVQMKYSPITLKMIKPRGARYYKKNGLTPKKRPYKEALPLYCVEVKEINPPDDACPETSVVEKPIHWILLTSLPVHSIQDALQIIDYYILRWIIERFHYLLKSGGANVEHLNFKDVHQLKNALVTYSFAAMDVLTLKYLAEKQPDLPIYQAGISIKEYEVLYRYVNLYVDKKVKYIEHQEPNIKEFVITLAKIGGFSPSKRLPTPGLKVLSHAYQKFKLILETFDLFCQRTE